MKHTNTNEFNAKVKDYLIPIIEDKAQDYKAYLNGKNPFQWIIDTARQEVPHEFQRRGNQAGLAWWLSGLGLNIDYYNAAIVELAEKWHGCRLTEKQAEIVVENWFMFIANKIMQFSRKQA